jgi:ketosteroid isomerase-like protein
MIARKRDGVRVPLAVEALVLIVATCMQAYSQTGVSTDSAAIMTRYIQFQEAIQNHDTISIGNSYALDAVSLLENKPVLRGRQSIASRWAKVLKGPLVFQITSQELNVAHSGQDAFQFGRFEIHSQDTAYALLASGKVLFVWRKQVDLWYIALEMDNFDAALPPKPPNK